MWLTCASRRFLAVGLRVLADARFTAFAFSRNTINVTTNSHGALCQVEIGASNYAKRLRANHVKFLARSLYPLEFRHRDCQRQWAAGCTVLLWLKFLWLGTYNGPPARPEARGRGGAGVGNYPASRSVL